MLCRKRHEMPVLKSKRGRKELFSTIFERLSLASERQQAFELAKMMKAEGHAVSLICGTQKTGPERVDVAYRDRVGR